jgi:hypothetical protein
LVATNQTGSNTKPGHGGLALTFTELSTNQSTKNATGTRGHHLPLLLSHLATHKEESQNCNCQKISHITFLSKNEVYFENSFPGILKGLSRQGEQ